MFSPLDKQRSIRPLLLNVNRNEFCNALSLQRSPEEKHLAAFSLRWTFTSRIRQVDRGTDRSLGWRGKSGVCGREGRAPCVCPCRLFCSELVTVFAAQ